MLKTIAHCGMRRLVEARSCERPVALPRFKKHMIAARALRALFSISLPVRAAVTAYLLLVQLAASALGAGACTLLLRSARKLPLLRALDQLVFSWIELSGSAAGAGRP